MPLCDGRSNGPGHHVDCPERRDDSTVRLRRDDLMLCDGCNEFRFPSLAASEPARSNRKANAGKKPASVIADPVTAATTTTATAGVDGAGVGQSSTASDNDNSHNSQCLHAADVKANELLSYVTYCRDRASVEKVRKVLIGFYTAGEINTAKKLLVSVFAASLTDCPLKAERRKSVIRDVFEAEVDDIIGIYDYMDQSFPGAAEPRGPGGQLTPL